MKARYWSLAIILILVNYLIFAVVFDRLVSSDFGPKRATRTPAPTFTPAPAQPLSIIIPTPTPVPLVPTPTATRVLAPDNANATQPEEANSESDVAAAQAAVEPQLVAPGAVNIRSGPGTNYTVIGSLNANAPVRVIGRNPDTSWWQIEITDGSIGWVASSVVSASNTDSVPAVAAPPSPIAAAPAAAVAQPAADAPPPAPEKPKYQYEPTGWYDDGNAGLTRFLGDIKDVNGNPVNGVFVQAKCGNFSVISFPSGPMGWGPLNESADWPAGFYDLTVDTKPVPCIWTLTVVDTDDRQTIKAVLSESVPVEITAQKSIVTANWRKNW
ncbi:MAG: SH3 domain-containing protein [Chloroflexi bacterium]|nr:SH3 domain-containing protein [Chloroflexota bacterium]